MSLSSLLCFDMYHSRLDVCDFVSIHASILCLSMLVSLFGGPCMCSTVWMCTLSTEGKTIFVGFLSQPSTTWGELFCSFTLTLSLCLCTLPRLMLASHFYLIFSYFSTLQCQNLQRNDKNKIFVLSLKENLILRAKDGNPKWSCPPEDLDLICK